jgi:hypothetical protein
MREINNSSPQVAAFNDFMSMLTKLESIEGRIVEAQIEYDAVRKALKTFLNAKNKKLILDQIEVNEKNEAKKFNNLKDLLNEK